MADQLRKSLKNTYWPKQEKILTKPSQERERTLCPTFFLAAVAGSRAAARCPRRGAHPSRGGGGARAAPSLSDQQRRGCAGARTAGPRRAVGRQAPTDTARPTRVLPRGVAPWSVGTSQGML